MSKDWAVGTRVLTPPAKPPRAAYYAAAREQEFLDLAEDGA